MTPDEQRRLVRTFAVLALPAVALVAASGVALRISALSADGMLPRAWILDGALFHALIGDAAIAVLIAVLFGPRVVRDFGARAPNVVLVLTLFGALLAAVVLPVLAFFTFPADGYRTVDWMPLVLGVGALAAAAAGARRDITTAALGLFGVAAFVVGVLYVVPAVAIVPLHHELITALTVVALAAAIEPLVIEAPVARAALAIGLSLLAIGPVAGWLNAPDDVVRLATLSSLGVPIVLSVAVRGAWRSRRPDAAAAIAAVLLAGPAWGFDRLMSIDPIMLHDTLAPSGALHLRIAGTLCAVMAVHPRIWRRRMWALPGLGLLFGGGAAFGWGFIVLGLWGMPTRYSSYDALFTHPQWVSSAGALVMVMGCAVAALGARPDGSGSLTPTRDGDGAPRDSA